MSPYSITGYHYRLFALLLWVAYRTGKGSDNESFFIGNRKSNWMLVAFGMIGTSTFRSDVCKCSGSSWKRQLCVFTDTLGISYWIYCCCLCAASLYYRLKLTSIYGYLQQRMGQLSYKSGAWIFIVSRLVGATARLYLVVNILQVTILDSLGVPFYLNHSDHPWNDYSLHL